LGESAARVSQSLLGAIIWIFMCDDHKTRIIHPELLWQDGVIHQVQAE